MSATTAAGDPRAESIPPLEDGQRLSRAEFEPRYHAMPKNVKAELIRGIVYMASPARFDLHARPDSRSTVSSRMLRRAPCPVWSSWNPTSARARHNALTTILTRTSSSGSVGCARPSERSRARCIGRPEHSSSHTTKAGDSSTMCAPRSSLTRVRARSYYSSRPSQISGRLPNSPLKKKLTLREPQGERKTSKDSGRGSAHAEALEASGGVFPTSHIVTRS